jgi:hypothetical protein
MVGNTTAMTKNELETTVGKSICESAAAEQGAHSGQGTDSNYGYNNKGLVRVEKTGIGGTVHVHQPDSHYKGSIRLW